MYSSFLRTSTSEIFYLIHANVIVVTGDVDANSNAESSNKAPEVEIEVQIMDLKDVYCKTTKKTLDGLEYPL